MDSLLSPVLPPLSLSFMTFNWRFLGTSVRFAFSALLVFYPHPQRPALSHARVWDRAAAGIKTFLGTPRLRGTAVAVDHFDLVSLANQAMTEGRQNVSQQVKGRRGSLQAVWRVKEQMRALLCTGTLAGAEAASQELKVLVEAAARRETNRQYRTVCKWWPKIEDLSVTGATTGKTEANITAIKNIKRTARGKHNAANYKSVTLRRIAVRTAA